MIRIHKDLNTADAVADNIKLLLGDIFENIKHLPRHLLLEDLLRINDTLEEWIIEKMNTSSFVNTYDTESKKPFVELAQDEAELDEAFIDEVFSYIKSMSVEDLINYRLNLIAESQKENPHIVEVG